MAFLHRMSTATQSRSIKNWKLSLQASMASYDTHTQRLHWQRQMQAKSQHGALKVFGTMLKRAHRQQECAAVVVWRTAMAADKHLQAELRGEDNVMEAQVAAQRMLDEFQMEASARLIASWVI